uniref:Disease resistance protein Roq1-like winged-helix domain-containing protein n=1 Tax=Salix viminalis TaxID=40686 RepID=A0A6N2LYG6_SALVM
MMMDEFDQRLSSVLQLFSLHAVRRKPCKDYEELQKRWQGNVFVKGRVTILEIAAELCFQKCTHCSLQGNGKEAVEASLLCLTCKEVKSKNFGRGLRWREALAQAGNLSGWGLNNEANGDKDGWKIDIAHWQNIPHDDIQAKLRVSFDALDVDSSEIFLDIACFFVAFRALIGRSLIAIDTENQNSLWMHDIVRKMGREIIRQRSRNHPGNCSRIVLPKDAYTVLSKEMGTDAVEGLALDVQGSFNTKSFKKMRRLQLLQITGAHLAGSYSLLPRELIWLCWPECPLKSLPSDFHIGELVILDMQGSKVRKLWKGTKSLVLLNLKDCNSLKTLPESMGSLKSLQTLNVTECSQLEKLPDSLGGLESLTDISRLTKLWSFRVQRCKNLLSISELPSSVLDLRIDDCTSIERVSAQPQHERMLTLCVAGCRNLIEIQGMEFAGNRWSYFDSGDCNNLSENSKMSLIQEPSLEKSKIMENVGLKNAGCI